jgi:hypothetical protein
MKVCDKIMIRYSYLQYFWQNRFQNLLLVVHYYLLQANKEFSK